MQKSVDLDRPVLGRTRLEHWLHGSILLLACGLRLYGLGARPLHHDESIHAYYAWRILTVGPSDYHYDPVYHGPALYYLTALFAGVLGPSDVSVRMLPVVTGLGLVALAWPLRALIGRREALVYALLLTLSPTIGYYSRSLRHDVPIAFFTLAALIAFLHFLRGGRRRHAYLAGVSIGLAAATKEDVYLSAFVFANALWMIAWVPLAGARSRARALEWAREVIVWLRGAWMPVTTAVVLALTIALVLYTSLLTHPRGWNAASRALRYWWGQHEVQRIGGPWWYYVPLEVGYEALVFLPALAMLATSLRAGARSRVEALFVLWATLAFALYAWAQEKVPWLLVPMLVPQAVLAACHLARQGARRLLAWTPLAAFGAWSLLASNYLYDAPRTTEGPATAHFEPLVYVQSTYDIRAVVDEIEAIASALGTGKRTSMVVVGDATWPLSWYLRDYAVRWNSLPRQTNAPILILDPGEAARLEKDLGDRYTARRFAVRGWWQIDWDRMTLGRLLRFLFARRVWNPTGTTDAVLLIANDLAPNRVPPPVQLRAATPARGYAVTPALGTGRAIGEPGSGPGQLSGPRGIALDRDGNLLVADSMNNRVQKLSPAGALLSVWGGPQAGDAAGQFRQPCGVAVAPDGSVYVADTWNHRIQKLDPEGRFVTQWRGPDGGFWGPRAIAVAPGGTVFVADTGNKRVVAYDPEGRKLFAFGGEGVEPGQLVEPVGLAIDPQGKILYVADTGNHRVQAFDLEGKLSHTWPVYGWQEFYTEPYLAWTPGTLWTTDSFNHRVNAYGALGKLQHSIGAAGGAAPLGRPLGIAVAADGAVFVSDFTAGRVWVFDAPPAAPPAAVISRDSG
ncbi:MAG: TIGR03663 family protein [Deltaproteobacteria bacterium]|nr:TIGR03663 family protein [Deltaproteobacteria bacterium]